MQIGDGKAVSPAGDYGKACGQHKTRARQCCPFERRFLDLDVTDDTEGRDKTEPHAGESASCPAIAETEPSVQ